MKRAPEVRASAGRGVSGGHAPQKILKSRDSEKLFTAFSMYRKLTGLVYFACKRRLQLDFRSINYLLINRKFSNYYSTEHNLSTYLPNSDEFGSNLTITRRK